MVKADNFSRSFGWCTKSRIESLLNIWTDIHQRRRNILANHQNLFLLTREKSFLFPIDVTLNIFWHEEIRLEAGAASERLKAEGWERARHRMKITWLEWQKVQWEGRYDLDINHLGHCFPFWFIFLSIFVSFLLNKSDLVEHTLAVCMDKLLKEYISSCLSCFFCVFIFLSQIQSRVIKKKYYSTRARYYRSSSKIRSHITVIWLIKSNLPVHQR